MSAQSRALEHAMMSVGGKVAMGRERCLQILRTCANVTLCDVVPVRSHALTQTGLVTLVN